MRGKVVDPNDGKPLLSGDHDSILGKFESDKLLTDAFTFEAVVLGARTIEFSTFMVQNLFGPNNTQVRR